MTAKLIKELIAESRVEEALDRLKAHPKYQTDNQLQNQIIMISARLSRNRQQENMNLIPLDVAMRERNAIAHSLLSLVERYNIEQGLNPSSGTTIAPIVEEKELPPDAVKVLFLASDPRNVGKLQMEQEFVKIQSHLSDNPASFHLKIHFDPRADTLTKTLLDERPKIVHFCGHGVGEIEGLHKAGIVLQNRDRDPYVLPSLALAGMFKLLSRKLSFQLVLLNACESIEQAKAVSQAGCYAIGMTKEIPDTAAVTFAGGFYLGLAESPDDIPFAFAMANNSLMMEGVNPDFLPRLYKDGEEVTDT